MIISNLVVLAEEENLSYTDTADSKYNTAIEALTEYGIISGNGGKFNPTDNLTRAETAKIMAYASGVGESEIYDIHYESYYPDVPPEYWAHNYIMSVSSYMSGYTDGNFRPDKNITYEQFVTIAVRMLGYQLYAEEGGGYPLGYRTIALTLDLTRNVYIKKWDDKITREEAAQIIYRTINAPRLVRAGDVTIDKKKYSMYRVADGTDGVEKLTLLDRRALNMQETEEQSN